MTMFSKAEALSSPLEKESLAWRRVLDFSFSNSFVLFELEILDFFWPARSSRSRSCLPLLGGRGLRTLCFDIWQRGGRFLWAVIKTPKVLLVKIIYLQGGRKVKSRYKAKRESI